MDASIDWFTLAITVPLVPMAAIVGALFWLRTVRPKLDEADALDDPPGICLVSESEPPAPGRDADAESQPAAMG